MSFEPYTDSEIEETRGHTGWNENVARRRIATIDLLRSQLSAERACAGAAEEMARISNWLRGKQLVYMRDRKAELSNELLCNLADELDRIVGWADELEGKGT